MKPIKIKDLTRINPDEYFEAWCIDGGSAYLTGLFEALFHYFYYSCPIPVLLSSDLKHHLNITIGKTEVMIDLAYGDPYKDLMTYIVHRIEPCFPHVEMEFKGDRSLDEVSQAVLSNDTDVDEEFFNSVSDTIVKPVNFCVSRINIKKDEILVKDLLETPHTNLTLYYYLTTVPVSTFNKVMRSLTNNDLKKVYFEENTKLIKFNRQKDVVIDYNQADLIKFITLQKVMGNCKLEKVDDVWRLGRYTIPVNDMSTKMLQQNLTNN